MNDNVKLELSDDGMKINGKNVPVRSIKFEMVAEQAGSVVADIELIDPLLEDTRINLNAAHVVVINARAPGERVRLLGVLDESPTPVLITEALYASILVTSFGAGMAECGGELMGAGQLNTDWVYPETDADWIKFADRLFPGAMKKFREEGIAT